MTEIDTLIEWLQVIKRAEHENIGAYRLPNGYVVLAPNVAATAWHGVFLDAQKLNDAILKSDVNDELWMSGPLNETTFDGPVNLVEVARIIRESSQ